MSHCIVSTSTSGIGMGGHGPPLNFENQCYVQYDTTKT